jgi:hypothetical protein
MESLVDNPDPFVCTIPMNRLVNPVTGAPTVAIGCGGRFRRGLGQPLPPDIRRMGAVH